MSLSARIGSAFGPGVECEAPLATSGAGLRITGVDLSRDLRPDQIEVLLDALAQYRLVTLPGQNLTRFNVQRFEQFANHWGAPVPHPNNFTRGGQPAQSDGSSDGEIALIPMEARTQTQVNQTFPRQISCLPHDSPAILVVSNFRGPRGNKEPMVVHGGSWHTDIEYEPLPVYVSMFLVHHVPDADDWVEDPDVVSRHPPAYFEGSPKELTQRRKHLPRNGATAFADTAAAFAALSTRMQQKLEHTFVRRRLNEGDPGWLAPLIRRNPRSGLRSLHSPIWASRPRVRPAIEVDGMTLDESREFLDTLEAHVLQSRFRYDHRHRPGDVTLWDNYMTLHNSPPMMVNIDDPKDARLMYRISCKGAPCLSLPREDSADWLNRHVTSGYRSEKTGAASPQV